MRESKSKLQCTGKKLSLACSMTSSPHTDIKTVVKCRHDVHVTGRFSLSRRTCRRSNRRDCHATRAWGSNYIIVNMCKICSNVCKCYFDVVAWAGPRGVCVCVWFGGGGGGGEFTGEDSSQSSQCFPVSFSTFFFIFFFTLSKTPFWLNTFYRQKKEKRIFPVFKTTF